SFLPDLLSPCNYVKVRVVTNQPAISYCINYSCVPVNGNIVEFNFPRGSTLKFDVGNSSGTFITRTIQTPPPIETASDKIRLAIYNSPNGGSVNVIHPATNLLTYEFSLDNENWQTSN